MCDRQRSFYLSANELMVICELARQNLAVFGRQESEARFLGGVTGHAESPLVLVVLHLDHAEGRVRGHFQRLVPTEDLQQAQELQHREAEAELLQQRELAAMTVADLEADAWRKYVPEAGAAEQQRERAAMADAVLEAEAWRAATVCEMEEARTRAGGPESQELADALNTVCRIRTTANSLVIEGVQVGPAARSSCSSATSRR